MKRTLALFSIVVATSISVAPRVDATTLALNFEDGLLPQQVAPWQLWATSNGSSSIVQDNGPSLPGGNAVEFIGTNDYGWYADLTGLIDVSKDYIFEYDVKTISEAQTVAGAVFVDGKRVDGVPHPGYPVDAWTVVRVESDFSNGIVRRYINGVLNAEESPVSAHLPSRYPGTVDYVTFGGSNNTQSFRHRFDNVRLTIVPEPATAIVCLLAVSAAAITSPRGRNSAF